MRPPRTPAGTLLGLLFCGLSPLLAARSESEETVFWILLGGGNRTVRQSGLGFRLIATAEAPRIIPAALNPVTDADGMIFEGPFPDCPHRFHFHGRMFGREDGGGDCGWGATIRTEDAPATIAPLAGAIDFELRTVDALTKDPPDLDAASSSLNLAALGLLFAQEFLEQAGGAGDIRAQDARILGRALEGPLKTDQAAAEVVERARDGQARPGELRRVQPRISGAIKSKRETFRILVKKYGLLTGGR